MKRPLILLAENGIPQQRQLQTALFKQGYCVSGVENTTGVLRALRHKQPLDLLLIAASLQADGDGLDLAQQIRSWKTSLPVIVLATQSSEDMAIAALRAGVSDYIKAPFTCEAIIASVQRCLARAAKNLGPEPEMETAQMGASASCVSQIIGHSQTMQDIKASIARVAPSDSQVLITGETGTGKELVATALHKNSLRRHEPFVDINCAAVPDSLLESELFGYERGAFTGANAAYAGKLRLAHRGTIFFDEIGDMSVFAQAKILRALESREVQSLGAKRAVPIDVRVIAATNQDLHQLMKADKFRRDLYYRLNVATVHLPPLRERKEDLQVLAAHYIQVCNQRFGRNVEGFTPAALEELLYYDWPGNIRELKNLIEATFINLPPRPVRRIDLPQPFRARLAGTSGLPQDERARILATLFSTNWNMSKAAQRLSWSRMTLYRKVAKYHITRDAPNAVVV